jgi:MarR family transcriptional regulator, 2-MHQ and catechol-resistance regulon repressor
MGTHYFATEMINTTTNPTATTPNGRDTERSTALKLWVVLARAHNAIYSHVQEDVAEHGLTVAEFGVLEVLYHKGPMLLGEVQRRILVSSGGITYLVDRLTNKGLVERRECPDDRRARYAALTPAGEDLIREIFPGHAERLREALSGLNAQEKRQAIELVRALGLGAESAKDLDPSA